MNIEFPKGCPAKVIQKAMGEFQKLANGEVRPKCLWCSRQHVQVLKIDYSYRAVCVNHGKWIVLSHETYNKKFL